MQKELKCSPDEDLTRIHDDHTETGMGFMIVESPIGIEIVLSESCIIPCYQTEPDVYNIFDYLKGLPLPTKTRSMPTLANNSFQSRQSAIVALNKAVITPNWTGVPGPHPLIGRVTLPANTQVYRNLSSSKDFRYDGTKLRSGTYVTTSKDIVHANTGFAIVGRYSLPLAIPASYFSVYELVYDADIEVGTVEPLFGQSGGGVEIRFVDDTPVNKIKKGVIDDL